MKIKKKTHILILLLSFLCVLVTNVYGQDNWLFYDDFSSGAIDFTKWNVDDSSAAVSIENGRLKFVHQPGYAGDSSWLSIADSAGTIRGVKATITVESCSVVDQVNGTYADVRVRIAGFLGTLDTDTAFTQHRIRPDRGRIEGGVSILGTSDHAWMYNLFWQNFSDLSSGIIGVPYTMSTICSAYNCRYGVEGHGEVEYTMPRSLGHLPTLDNFVGIGTQSDSGIGTCTVYVDDIYVLREQSASQIPIRSLLLLNN